jgi:hypothetical protein
MACRIKRKPSASYINILPSLFVVAEPTCNKVAARSFQLIVMVFANSRKGHAKHFQSLSAQLP